MNGYTYATDSNADWGQDLKRLEKWIHSYNTSCTQPGYANDKGAICYSIINPNIYDPAKSEFSPIKKIHVDYFGGGDIFKTIGQNRAILWWDSKRPIEPGWYAISVNFSQGSIHDRTKKDEESYRWLKNYTPVAQVGTSMFIYSIP